MGTERLTRPVTDTSRYSPLAGEATLKFIPLVCIAPVRPTNATLYPAIILKLRSFITKGVSSLYLMATFLNSISPFYGHLKNINFAVLTRIFLMVHHLIGSAQLPSLHQLFQTSLNSEPH